MPTFAPGDVFHGLRVERLIATAHGEVFAVRHASTGEPFALKTIQLADRSSVGVVQRALAAARGAHGIDRPNVVKVYDAGGEPDGTVYLVMELLHGCSVDVLIRWGRVSPVFALSVAIEAARGLGAVHAALIIHRDVKPSNLFLVNAGAQRSAIKLLDFSMAKVFEAGIETTTGGVPGSGRRPTSLRAVRRRGAAPRLRRVRTRDDPLGAARRVPPLPHCAARSRGAHSPSAERHAPFAVRGRGPRAAHR